eukprot:gene27186-27425_t
MGAMARVYLAWQRGEDNKQGGWLEPFMFWTGLAVSILVKGPLILMFVGFTILVLGVMDRSVGWLGRLKPLAGIPWTLLLVLPWFVAIYLKAGQSFFSDSLGGDMLSKLCDGLVLLLPNAEDGYLDVIEKQRIPAVFFSFEARDVNVPVVAVENRQAARSAVEHLIGLGHRRIAFIAGSKGTGQSAQREKGYIDALTAAGLPVLPELMEVGRFVQAGGYAATERLLALAQLPTAIFAANDEMAFGAIDAIHSKGLKVPGDISVMGFDDIPTA